MIEAGIGRLLVASLHQAIADLLPTRLEFYESWLHPRGLRDGRIGLAPLAAVLSFLRQEGEAYTLIAARAGEYTAEWTVTDLSTMHRGLITRAPRGLRIWLVMRIARQMIRSTYKGSRGIISWRRGEGAVDLRGSIFCEVRAHVQDPLCEFYAAAIRRLMGLCDLDVEVGITSCRATGTGQCLMNVTMRAVAILLLSVCPAFAQVGSPAGAMLVVPFENAKHEARLYWLGEGSSVLLADNLRALGVRALTREERVRAFQHLNVPPVATLTHATVIKLGQLVGATHVVVGAFDVASDTLTVRVRAIRLDTGRLLDEIVEQGRLDAALDIYARASRRLVPDPKLEAAELVAAYPPVAAFEQYIKGLIATTPAAQLSYFEQAMKLAPAFHRARLAEWEAYDEQNDHKRALAVVRQVPASDPLSRAARFRESLSLLNLAIHDEAVAMLTSLNEVKRDAALLNNLGVAQLRRPKIAGSMTAASYFRDAASADPEDPDLFFNAGYAAWFEKDAKGAIGSLREAVRRNPADDQAHFVLGVALQATGNATEGAREKELAKKLSSEYAEWETKQPAGAPVPRGLERIRTEIDAGSSLRVESVLVASEQREQRQLVAFLLDRGRRLFQQEKDAEAIAELRRAVYLAPYEAEAHLLLGRIYLRTGREKDAVDALTISVWSDPSNAEARTLLERITPGK